jgi:thiamine-phosphate diphosphorylase
VGDVIGTLDARPVICLVTHGERLAPGAPNDSARVDDAIIRQVREAAAAGVDLVQVRELERDALELCRLVERCVAAVHGTGTRVVVNDRVDVALAAGAHGVHLRSDSYPATRIRRLVPEGFLVGRSVHERAEAAAVTQAGGVDYLVFGTVFPTESKPRGAKVAGLTALAEVVAAAAPVPVLAIGGASVSSAVQLAATGVRGVAAIGLFLAGEAAERPTIAMTVQQLRQAFDSVSAFSENTRGIGGRREGAR